MPDLTILVAEDFPAFREFTCAELQRRADFRVVMVADGQAAVETVEALRPDLVLLDIGLPRMNGLDAARRIRSQCAAPRIVFLTQESSPDIVHAALDLGADGYIDKTRAQHLLPVVEAVLDRAVTGAGSPGDHVRGDTRRDHHVHFYSADWILLETAGRFLASAITAGDAAVAMCTQAHRQPLIDRMKAWGADVDRALGRDAFVFLDAADTAALIATEGLEHCRPLLRHVVESAAAATGRSQPRVAGFSECAPLLCASGHVEAAIGLERLGNDFVRALPIDILCTYPLGTSNGDPLFKRICTHHSAVAVR